VTVQVTDGAGNVTTVTAKGAPVTEPTATAPPTGTMVLNGGDADTYASVVRVDSSGVSGATEMRTSTDRANWTAWRPFAADSLVALPGLPGAKTVYVQYRNADPTVLERSASIQLAATSMSSGDRTVCGRWATARSGPGAGTERVSSAMGRSPTAGRRFASALPPTGRSSVAGVSTPSASRATARCGLG